MVTADHPTPHHRRKPLPASHRGGVVGAAPPGSDQLRARLAGVDRQIAAGAGGSVLPELASGPDPAEVWAKLDFDRRRAVIEVLVDVTVLPARRGRRLVWRPGEPYFDPESVRVEPKRPGA